MPAVLLLSGLDPSGGAGISADIQTLCVHGVHSLPVVTCLTAQNTKQVMMIEGVDDDLITEQINLLAQDINIDAIKIGLLFDAKQIQMLIKVLSPFKHLPIVLDPIINASTKQNLLGQSALVALKKLLPLCICITPNTAELNALSTATNEVEQVAQLPTPWVLVTKTDTSTHNINHMLYHCGQLEQTYTYQKLPHEFHGSGCTLSSAIIAQIILGNSIPNACQLALDWTYTTLKTAHKLGKAQYHPNRLGSL